MGDLDGCGSTPNPGQYCLESILASTHRTLDEYVIAGKTIKVESDGLVFSEARSALIGPNNKPIAQF